jgi:hypothetical protein
MTIIDDKQITLNDLSIQQKLNLETAVIKWKDLQVFFAQGKLLIISNCMDLIEVATIIAENDAKKLSKLIEAKSVQFATIDWVKENAQESSELWAVVVSPYVVAQLKVD